MGSCPSGNRAAGAAVAEQQGAGSPPLLRALSFLPTWVWLPRTQPNRLHLVWLWASCRLPWDRGTQEQAAA